RAPGTTQPTTHRAGSARRGLQEARQLRTHTTRSMLYLMRNATRIVGFEGGGTKSEWVVCRESKGRLIVEEQGNLPASNLRLTTDDRLRHMFTSLPHDLDKIGVFLAGCVTPEDQ